MKYQPIDLNYDFNALEPFIDTQTMEIHFTRHYQTYINNLNALLEKYPDMENKDIQEIIRNIGSLDIAETDKKAILNNGGGYLNHNVYWANMDPANKPDEALITEAKKEFGSVEELKKALSDLSLKHFGSGWGWLVRDNQGKLKIYSTPNQDSPLMKGDRPIIGLDVWEHAYYLKYQNKRAEYIRNWWKTVKILG